MRRPRQGYGVRERAEFTKRVAVAGMEDDRNDRLPEISCERTNLSVVRAHVENGTIGGSDFGLQPVLKARDRHDLGVLRTEKLRREQRSQRLSSANRMRFPCRSRSETIKLGHKSDDQQHTINEKLKGDG